jgi:hypothetical protein
LIKSECQGQSVEAIGYELPFLSGTAHERHSILRSRRSTQCWDVSEMLGPWLQARSALCVQLRTQTLPAVLSALRRGRGGGAIHLTLSAVRREWGVDAGHFRHSHTGATLLASTASEQTHGDSKMPPHRRRRKPGAGESPHTRAGQLHFSIRLAGPRWRPLRALHSYDSM